MKRRTLSAAVAFLLLAGALSVDLAPRARAEAHEDENQKRHNTPQKTVRTFFRAISMSQEAPHLIQVAEDCLDLSGSAGQDPGLLAKHLEAILSIKEIDTDLIPNTEAVPGMDPNTYVLFDDPLLGRVALERSGFDVQEWKFDPKTVAAIPKMWPVAQKRLQEKNKEAAALNISPDFASPRATFWTFTTAYYRHDLERARKCLDLSDVPRVAQEEVGTQLINKLRQIMYRERPIIFQDIPDTNYSVPYLWLSQASGVVELVRTPTGQRKGEWVFSRETVRSIDALYHANEDLPPDAEHQGTSLHLPTFWHQPELWVRHQMPGWLKMPLLGQAAVARPAAPPPPEQGQPPQPPAEPQQASRPPSTETKLHLALYELLGYVLLLALAGVVTWLTIWLLALVMRGFVRWRGWDVPPQTIKKRLRPTGFFLGCLLLHWGVLILGGSEPLMISILTVLNPLLWILGTWALFRWIDLIGDLVEAHLVAGKRGVEIAQMLWPVGSLASKIALFLVTMFHLMELFAWDVSTVLAGLGIGGVAFALGAQDSLKNLFGSFTLIADRPFVVGENVKIGDRDVGVVEVVGLRSTRIRTADDTLLIVPNSNLTTMNITNYGRRRYRRLLTQIGVAYGTPPEQLLAFRDGIREIIMGEKRTRKTGFDVAVNELGDSAIKLVVSVYFEVADARQESEARESLILAILALADRLRIDLAFPTQTVHLVPPEPARQADGRPAPRSAPAPVKSS
jgi:MscS family membrane protein